MAAPHLRALDETVDVQGIKDLIQSQRAYFAAGHTRDLKVREERLKTLRHMLLSGEDALLAALKADLNKPNFEGWATELGFLILEIDHTLKHFRSWAKPTYHVPTLLTLPGMGVRKPEPLGVTLTLGAWNYPLQLTLAPIIGALAAGNTCIVKPSEISPETSKVMAQLVSESFDPRYVAVVEGGVETSQALLEERFDKIFFTGGTAIGRIIMEAAAKHLTPVTLELGGKSPCIVDTNVDLKLTAKRIVWGKFVNSGQTCIAPDYLLVHESMRAPLLAQMKETVRELYGEDPSKSDDLCTIVSDRHFNRLSALLDNGTQVFGGQTDPSRRFIAPTVLTDVDWDMPVMQEEIFGPILPVLTYSDLDSAITQINARPRPLALYIFSKDKSVQERITERTSSGGVCINDTLMHISHPDLPFGGVGQSGMGSYHGEQSFREFSHYKSTLTRPFWGDLPLRYPPYSDKALSLLKKLFRV